jgi:hypothetical protein
MSILLKHFSSTSGNPQQGLLGYSSSSTSTADLSSILHRVVTLCCASIGGNTNNIDLLTQTAAARIAALLTSAARAQQSSNTLDLFESSSGKELLTWMSTTPMISLACRRVLDEINSSSSKSSSSGAQLQMALGNLIVAQLDLMSIEAPSLDYFMINVFTGSRLIEHISGTNALNKILEEEALFSSIAEWISSVKKKTVLFTAAVAKHAVILLTNLTALFTKPRKGDGRVLASQETSKYAFSRAADVLVEALQLENNNKFSVNTTSESLVRVFGDAGVALKLQSAMELSKFCELYCCIFEIIDHQSVSGGGGGHNLRLLSAIAFGSSGEGNKQALLPELWRYLAVTVGLPLEISAVATKFEVPSLPHGVHSIPSSSLQPFLLFCRAMAHYLSTADDVEFYEEQGLFSLATQRAIAVGLSTFIFRTHLPLSLKSSSSTASSSINFANSSLNSSKRLLVHAPRLLRALFDRDTRRQFCPPALWLGSYSQLVRAGNADVSGAAVLRALLQVDRSSSQDEQEDEENEGQRSHPVTTSSSSTSAATGLAAVLLSAPQLIPFEERVEVFRGLVSLDKQS